MHILFHNILLPYIGLYVIGTVRAEDFSYRQPGKNCIDDFYGVTIIIIDVYGLIYE